MNFKRKAGAAVLAIAAASAIAVPGVAMAEAPAETVVVAPASGTGESAVAAVTTGYNYVMDTTGVNQVAEVQAYYKGAKVGYFVTDMDNTKYRPTNTVDAADLTKLFVTTDDSDDIEGFLSFADTNTSVTDLTYLYISNDELDTVDLTDATALSYLYINGSDLTDIDGLDKVGTKVQTYTDTDNAASKVVTVEIKATDLSSVDFGDNDSILDIKLDADLETLDMSDLENMIGLDVQGSTDLTSLDVSGDDDLAYLNISNTKIAALDVSDTSIDAAFDNSADRKPGLVAYNVSLDSQYAAEAVNDDDDDYNDYAFDIDSITGGHAELVSDEASKFFVTTTNKGAEDVPGDTTDATDLDNLYADDDWFDYDNGDLTITAKDVPDSITYTVVAVDGSDDDTKSDVTYKVSFDVTSAGSRIAGTDRYDTMIEVNTDEGSDDFDETFTDVDGKAIEDIVVASGAGYADALSSSALAGALNTGIVTTPVDSLTDDTIDMLDDMDDKGTAYIVGGTSAVSYAVEQQLTDLGFSIQRMAGADRFDTAVKTQDKIQDLIDEDGSVVDDNNTVIIASGVNYADALAIAPYAYNKNTPIVLVGADGTMDDSTAALFNKYKNNYSNAIVVGGTAVVSEDVIDTLEGYDMDVIRLAGADRFETNLVINDWLDRGTSNISTSDEIFEAAGYSSDDIDDFNDAGISATDNDADTDFVNNDFDGTAYVVTGLNYADALAVAPLAGVATGTINMVSDTDITTITEAIDNDAEYKVVGGTSAISSDLFDAIENLD